jgi:signal peptidase I
MSDAQQRDRNQLILTWTLIPLSAVFVSAIILLYVLFTTALVDGRSMYPTLENGDYLIVQRDYPTPLRGDVIVYQGADFDGQPVQVVKRVIAVPGDTVEVDSGNAIVNGQPEVCEFCVTLEEGDTSTSPLIVPEGTVFTMGDNRPVSLDSRHYGPVSIDRIAGRARYIFAPFSRVGVVDEPPDTQ